MFAWLRGHFNLEQTNKDDGADSGLCVICGGLGIGGYVSYDRETDSARRFLSLEVEGARASVLYAMHDDLDRSLSVMLYLLTNCIWYTYYSRNHYGFALLNPVEKVYADQVLA